jgi:hypothetical protein
MKEQKAEFNQVMTGGQDSAIHADKKRSAKLSNCT